MTFALQADSVLRVDDRGAIRVGGTRVLLDLVVEAFNAGHSPEIIADEYPSLTLADVYAAVAYYLQHRSEVDSYLARRERQADEVQAKIEASQPDTKLIRERLRKRRDGESDASASG